MLTEGVLEAEVEEDAALPAARAYADRHADAGDDLQAFLKIVRPANAGVDQRPVAALLDSRPHHRLLVDPQRLEHHVEISGRQPDQTLPEVEIRCAALLAAFVPGRWRVGRAGVQVRDE